MISLSLTRCQRPSPGLPCSCQICPQLSGKGSPSTWLVPASAKPAAAHKSSTYRASHSCQPRVTHTNKSHPPTGTKGHPPSCLYKACLLQPLLPSAVLCGPARHAVYLLPRAGITRLINCCQVHLSSVRCHVFSHLVLFRAMNSSFINWVNKK